jgi:hypothetical protein
LLNVIDVKRHWYKVLNLFISVEISSIMDKSALQQRLEARRNMFFNKPDPATATASSALNFAAARIGKAH